ncbi:MAG: ECF transporter S component [Candidatus Hodarchaeota archaeon]
MNAENKTTRFRILFIVITGLFTALTYFATAVFVFPITASGGGFFLGEMMIYIAAFSFGPYVAGFAGGVGSALADVISGTYAAWAPGTLAIKFAEGFVVGYLFKKLKNLDEEKEQDPKGTVIKLLSGFLMSLLIVIFGIAYLPSAFLVFVLLSIVFLLTMLITMYVIKRNVLRFIIPLLCGCAIMVVGYLIYGLYAFNSLDNLIHSGSEPVVNYGAFLEILYNILQCFVGIVISIPVYQAIKKSKILDYYYLYSENETKIDEKSG